MDSSAFGRSQVAGNDSFVDGRRSVRSGQASASLSNAKRKDAPTLQVVQLSDAFSAPLAKKLKQLPKYAEVKQGIVKTPLPSDPIAQEAVLTRELLLLLIGLESAYISFSQAYDPNILTERLVGPDFRYQRSIEPSLRELAMSIAATAKHYMVVDAFTESQSQDRFGRVNQALCASLRGMLKDFRLAVAQLETAFMNEKEFSLQKLKTRLSPYASRLKHAYGVARAVMEANELKAQESMGALRGSALEDKLDDLKQRKSLDTGAHAMNKHYVCKGGAVLRLLAQRRNYFAGDEVARKLLDLLLRDASQPYLEMLEQWINKGVIVDPHREFLIEEAISAKSNPQVLPAFLDEYWQNKYRVHTDGLPLQLSSRDVYDKILQAGRYLNVIRECGGADVSTDGRETFDSIEDSRIILSVNQAYQHANTSLLKLLIHTHKMTDLLNSLKHYYFLDRADYFINFLDIAGAELSKPASQASRTSLQYLLDMALRHPGSISSEDPYKEDVVVKLNSATVIEKLMLVVQQEGVNPDLVEPRVEEDQGGEQYVRLHAPIKVPANQPGSRDDRKFLAIMALELHFNIPFPLSLFITPTCIIRYKFIFRYLVCLKHIERSLSSTWVNQKKMAVWRLSTPYTEPRLGKWKAATARLRSAMLTFIQHLLYYSTVEVLDRNYKSFAASIDSSESVDHLIVEHGQFLYTCMTDMMITHLDLLTVQDKLFQDCRNFVSLMDRANTWMGLIDEKALPAADRVEAPRPRSRSGQEYTNDELMSLLEQRLEVLSEKFARHMRNFIETINDSASQESTIRLIIGARLEMLFTNAQP